MAFPSFGNSEKVVFPANPDTVAARQQGLGAEPVVTADWLPLSSMPLYPIFSVQGKKGPRALGWEWEQKEGWLRPLGSVVALLMWDPALSRNQEEQQTEHGSGVTVQIGGRHKLGTIAGC